MQIRKTVQGGTWLAQTSEVHNMLHAHENPVEQKKWLNVSTHEFHAVKQSSGDWGYGLCGLLHYRFRPMAGMQCQCFSAKAV